MTQPIAKRADQLIPGDRIPESQLIYKFNKGPAEVVFLADEPEDSHTFIAYRYPNRRHESMTVRSEAMLQVYPADTGLGYSRADDGETTQPIAGRVPAHFGAVEVAGGLVDIDPPEVRCATSEPHAPHRTTFAAEMGIANGICPGRCTQDCIDLAVHGAPMDAHKGWHDDDCPAVIDIADVR